jgi:phosphatidylglycerophosphate synthase
LIFDKREGNTVKYFESNIKLIRRELEYFGFWTWANIVTTFRLGLMIPAIIFLLLGSFQTLTFLLLFAACALDGVDGWTARRFNCKTIIGGLFDKVTDKVIIKSLTAILLLLLIGYLAPKYSKTVIQLSSDWLIYLLITELGLLILGVLSLWFPIIPNKAGRVGKLKMIVECTFLFLCYFTYLRPFGFGFDDLSQVAKIGNFLLRTSFWLAIGSGLDYGLRGWENYRFAEKLSER